MVDFLLPEEDATSQEEQLALANALRREQALGVLGQLSGDKVLSQVGGTLFTGAQHGRALQEQAKGRRFQAALQAKRDQAEQDYRNQDLELKREAAGRERFRPEPALNPTTGKEEVFAFDPRSGRMQPTGVEAPKRSDVRGQALVGRLSETMMKDLDPSQWGGAGKDQVVARNQAEHILGLAKRASGDGFNNLDTREMGELALGFARLVKGGQPTEHEARALVPPKTLQAGAAGIKEWLFNEPTGLDQLKFIEKMSHSVERQMKIADGIINRTKAQRSAAHRKLKAQDPEQWEANIIAAGMDPTLFDDKGVYRMPEEKPPAQDDAKARISARIKELGAGGMTDKAEIRKQLVKDGLLKGAP